MSKPQALIFAVTVTSVFTMMAACGTRTFEGRSLSSDVGDGAPDVATFLFDAGALGTHTMTAVVTASFTVLIADHIMTTFILAFFE